MSDSSGTPVPSGPWASAVSTLSSVDTGALGLTCMGLGCGFGPGPSLARAELCLGLASELVQPGHHFLTQVMSWSSRPHLSSPMLIGDPAATTGLCSVRLFRRVPRKGSPSRQRHSCSLMKRVVSCLHEEPWGGSLWVE